MASSVDALNQPIDGNALLRVPLEVIGISYCNNSVYLVALKWVLLSLMEKPPYPLPLTVKTSTIVFAILFCAEVKIRLQLCALYLV